MTSDYNLNYYFNWTIIYKMVRIMNFLKQIMLIFEIMIIEHHLVLSRDTRRISHM